VFGIVDNLIPFAATPDLLVMFNELNICTSSACDKQKEKNSSNSNKRAMCSRSGDELILKTVRT